MSAPRINGAIGILLVRVRLGAYAIMTELTQPFGANVRVRFCSNGISHASAPSNIKAGLLRGECTCSIRFDVLRGFRPELTKSAPLGRSHLND